MTSARRIEANRRNARASTGPRTVAGKARAAQNARRHGLNLPARYDPSRSGEIDALARAIAGADAGAERLELASRIAAAQIDVERARRARLDLYPQALRERDAIARLAAIDRYEGRALSARKRAMRDFDDASDRASTGTLAGISAERSQRAKVRSSLGNGGFGAAGVSFKLSASSIYPWDGPEAALIRSMIAKSLRPTRPLPGHFDKTKPTAKCTRVTEARERGVRRAEVRTQARLSPHEWRSTVPTRHSRGRETDAWARRARPRGKSEIEARRLAHPTGVDAGVTLPAHFDKTKPTARMPRVTESSPRSRVGKGADPELASHHTNGAAPCPRVTREVERPTRGQGAQGRAANQNRSQAPCPPYGSHRRGDASRALRQNEANRKNAARHGKLAAE